MSGVQQLNIFQFSIIYVLLVIVLVIMKKCKINQTKLLIVASIRMTVQLGMGVISLPGMMTGQILSGTLPSTAILYQIAILIAICTVTCLSVFCSLYFGYRTLYNKRNQMVY